MARTNSFVILVLIACLLGCEDSSSSSTTASTTASSGGPPPPPPLDRPPLTAEDIAPPPATQQDVAAVGAGRKGHGYGNDIFTAPLSIRWRAEEKIIFEIRIPQAMRLYEALHEKKPTSHEVFMKDIIEENGIVLPELPEGHKYVYDPQKGELMVEKPNPEAAK